MNEQIRLSIDAKKKAIFDYHDVKSNKTKEKIDNYFRKVEEFGKNYDDIMKFENDFAASPLMKEYTDLFTAIIQTENVGTMVEDVNVLEEVKDNIEHRFKMETREKRDKELRNMPVIGDVLNVKQHIDLFSRFKKNNKE